ncbi:MAG: competence/damage-inducible protein A [Planctomycetota bacterium]|jgi:nicotinamide-nucleotide amidase
MNKDNISILSIGEELLLGQIVDTNSSFLASRLWEIGFALKEVRVVGDDLEKITTTIGQLADENDFLILTGGLGPTVDDLTRDALAGAAGVELTVSDEMLEEIKLRFKRINRPMADSNKRQALVPVGAKGISNKYGTAPGIDIEINDCRCFSMPGVPMEMKNMFENYVVPEIDSASRNNTLIKELKLFGVGESAVGEILCDLMKRGRNPVVGTRVKESVISVRIVASAENYSDAEKLICGDIEVIKGHLGKYVFGEDDDSLSSVAVKNLIEKNKTLALAESCTGGLISKLITDISGSSQVFKEGFVTYSNKSKIKNLGVCEDAINSFGAVSENVATQMAEGVRKASGVDYGIGVTGIAGPGGGTDGKPVGLIFIAVSSEEKTICRECRFSYDRESNRNRAANTALAMLLDIIN